jgi:hypothetical protein
LTAAEPPPKGLVLHFGFDRAESGGTVTDLSGRNNHGKATGAKWTSYGKKGGGCEFAAPDSCLRVPHDDGMTLKQATFSFWFRTVKSDAVWRYLLARRDEKGWFGVAVGGDGKSNGQDVPTRGKLVVTFNGQTICFSDAVVVDGSWHHAAVAFDGESVKIYIDGRLQKQSGTFRGELPAPKADLTIGLAQHQAADPQMIAAFDGVLDELMVFNRALALTEIQNVVAAVDPVILKPKFTKQQVAGRLRQLKLLYDEGWLTEEFYKRKVAECEEAQ